MSLNFMKMVSDIHSRRYLRQIQNLVWAKVPCGIFGGITISENFVNLAQQIRNLGINLTCTVVADNNSKSTLEKIVAPVYTLDDVAKGSVNINNIFYEEGFLNDAFSNFFGRYGIVALPIANLGGKENLFNFYMQHLPELYSVYEMFPDGESKAV